jgi:hypothetical protein
MHDWLSFLLGFIAGTITFFSVLWLFRKKHEPQITIQDLIECAEAGKWTKTLPQKAEQTEPAVRIVK